MPAASRIGLTQRQSARIDRILSVTQKLLGELGAEAMTMRDVARASHVAEGTLYNRFGTKDGLLTAAVVEYFERAVQSPVEHQGRKTPLRKLIFSADVVVVSILEAKSFARTLMGTYFRVGNDREMPERLAEMVRETWKPLLIEMQARELLLPWVSLKLLVEDLCDREFGVVVKWAQGGFDDEQLRDRLVHALLVPLLGQSRGQQAEEIERELRRLTRQFTGTAAKRA